MQRKENNATLKLTKRNGTIVYFLYFFGSVRPRGMECFVACLCFVLFLFFSQGRVCLGNFKGCHTEIKAADHIFSLTYTELV